MKRTAIYIRVSSDKQVQEGDSIAAQRQALTKYIDDRPDLVLAGEYIDDGISGTKFHQFAAAGCTMQGLCTITRRERRWGDEEPTEVIGIRFEIK